MDPTQQLGAVILAAGAGRRMGEGPKALVPLHDATFLERVIAACSGGGARPVVTVVRPADSAVATLALRLGARPIVNPEPDRGMFSSVQVGIAGLLEAAPDLAGVVIFPVDHAAVRAETVAAIARQVLGGGDWVVPTHGGVDGHPIGLSCATARSLLALPPDRVLRDALSGLGAGIGRIPVSDPGVVRNMNTQGDVPGA